MVELCLGNHLRACNGRSHSDQPGNPTFYRGKYRNTLDYLLLHTRLWPDLVDFEIMVRHESDHYPLLLNLKAPYEPVLVIDQKEHTGTATVTNNRRNVKWSSVEGSPHQMSSLYEIVSTSMSKMCTDSFSQRNFGNPRRLLPKTQDRCFYESPAKKSLAYSIAGQLV